jgi:magnesium transporter
VTGLGHASERADAHLGAEVPTAAPHERAAAVRARIAAGTFDSIDRVWILDDGVLSGVVAIGELLRAEASAPVGDLAAPPPAGVDVGVDQEHLAHHAITADLDLVPVTRDGRFVGVVPARTLLGVLQREHTEDLHRLAGISPARGAIARTALHRLPWLAVGLAGSLGASLILAGFEEMLRRNVAVAFFVPAIVYVADAVGTQTEALVVRRLAIGGAVRTGEALRELGAGGLLGVVLGALAGPAVWAMWGNAHLGLAVGIAVLVACSAAAGIGLALPWALARAGRDPALGSGPLATVIQDALSIVVYLGVVRVLVD